MVITVFVKVVKFCLKYLITCKYIITCKTIVTVSNHRTVPVKILNAGNDPVTILKGKIVAKFSHITNDFEVKSVNDVSDLHGVQNINLVQQRGTRVAQ